MVKISIGDGKAVFEPLGLHKLWALKRRIEVPLTHVTSVRADASAASGLWKGWRLPGTYLPGVITAGSFFRDGTWTFYDVVDGARTVVIDLDGERYRRLIVEVADPEKEVARFREVAAR